MNTILKAGNCGAGKKLALAALLLTAAIASAEELGRLFFTPEQRTQLEYDKSHSTDYGSTHRTLTVNGIVQKHGGARTVWINGISQLDDKGNGRAPESLSISAPGQAHPVKIKVGQKVLLGPPASGQ